MDTQPTRPRAGVVASWHSLPPDVKEHVWRLMVKELPHDCRQSMRGVCRDWQTWHDARCRTLKLKPDAPDDNYRAVFGRFSGLVELEICHSRTLTGYGLWRLASVGLSGLTSLDLGSNYYDDYRYPQLDCGYEALGLGGFPALQTLNLFGCAVTDEALKHISKITSLTHLNLGGCVFRAACVRG